MKLWTHRFAMFALVAVCTVVGLTINPASLVALPFLMGDTTVIDDIDEALKIIFSDPLVEQVVADSELLSIFETEKNVQTEQTTGGRFTEMAHFFQWPAGVGARGDNEYIPEPDDPVFKNSRIFLRKVQGTVEMTGDVMRRVRSDEGAFLNYMERALPSLVDRLTNELDRMYIGFGSGILAQVNDAAPDTTLVVDNSFGVTGYEDPWLTFLEGQRIVFSANANGDPLRSAGANQSAKVVDIEEDSNTITVDALPTGVADDDFIFPGDEAGASTQLSGANREIAGLLAAVDDGGIVATYNNISRTTGNLKRLWQSIVIDASVDFAGTLTEDLLLFADDEVAVKGGGKIDCLVMSRSASRSYWKSLKGDRFYIDPRSYAGGTGGDDKSRGLSIILGSRTLPLYVARKLPPQVVFGLQSNTFKRITLGTWEWDDRTGSIWNRVTDSVGRKDAFYAVGNMYEELFCMKPRCNFRIDGLTRAK